MTSAIPRIGLSACFFHPDPERNIFKGKTLLFCEQSMAHYVMSAGIMPCLVPSEGGVLSTADMVAQLDGLLLTGGADVAPESYGESPMKPEWAGDYVRDQYEIALVQACLEQDTPVFGICRGAQILNVALHGTLYQDITTQHPNAIVHRSWEHYDHNHHGVRFAETSGLAQLYANGAGATINSVHHQGIKDVGDGLTVEAWATEDDVIEAVRYTANPDRYLFGVQWHPEFIDDRFPNLLDPQPILDEFLTAARQRLG